MSGAVASPFPADALAANQAGRLTDAQRSLYAADDRSFRKTELYVAIGAAVIAVLLLTSSGSASSSLFKPVAIVVCVALAIVLVVRATLVRDALASDLAAGSVVSMDGAILKRVVQSSGRSAESSHYLIVAGKQFKVGPHFYAGAPEAGYVRAYYLPKSSTLVNLEQLPDKPLPAGMADDPSSIAKLALDELKTRDPNARAEVRAEMAVLKKSYEQDDASTAVPAAPGTSAQTGQPPLAEAIVGKWRSGPIEITVDSDGTLSTVLPGGQAMTGRWSVDSSGLLHADVAGQDIAGQAWIEGSTLTVKDGAEGRVFHRA
jgi:hypothetical protein